MHEPLQNFWEKTRQVGALLNTTEDYKSAEPILFEIVQLVRSHPDLRSQFDRAFLEVFAKPDQFSNLVVEYGMHVLRSSAVRQAAMERISRDPLRTDASARHVVEAYSDTWSLASIFSESLSRLK